MSGPLMGELPKSAACRGIVPATGRTNALFAIRAGDRDERARQSEQGKGIEQASTRIKSAQSDVRVRFKDGEAMRSFAMRLQR
jgi:hypothetical protein